MTASLRVENLWRSVQGWNVHLQEGYISVWKAASVVTGTYLNTQQAKTTKSDVISERMMEMAVKCKICGIIKEKLKIFGKNKQNTEEEKNKAFIEGYCYAIKVLEDNLARDKKESYLSDLDIS